MAPQNVCRYFKFGYCKFGLECRLMHISELCDNSSCDIKTCNLRHPRICNFYRDYRRCKFGEWCQYKHENLLETLQNDNQAALGKINDIEKLLSEREALDDKIKECDKKLDLFGRTYKFKR